MNVFESLCEWMCGYDCLVTLNLFIETVRLFNTEGFVCFLNEFVIFSHSFSPPSLIFKLHTPTSLADVFQCRRKRRNDFWRWVERKTIFFLLSTWHIFNRCQSKFSSETNLIGMSSSSPSSLFFFPNVFVLMFFFLVFFRALESQMTSVKIGMYNKTFIAHHARYLNVVRYVKSRASQLSQLSCLWGIVPWLSVRRVNTGGQSLQSWQIFEQFSFLVWWLQEQSSNLAKPLSLKIKWFNIELLSLRPMRLSEPFAILWSFILGKAWNFLGCPRDALLRSTLEMTTLDGKKLSHRDTQLY